MRIMLARGCLGDAESCLGFSVLRGYGRGVRFPARQWLGSIRRRAKPVRVRLTLLATALVTVALTIAAVVLVVVIHQVLLYAAGVATASRATQISDVVSAEGVDSLDVSLLTPTRNVDLVQVVDAADRVRVTSSSTITAPLTEQLAPGRQVTLDGVKAVPDGPEYRVTVLGVTSARDGPLTIVVGAAERPIDWLVLVVGIMCCIVFPLIVIGMVVLTYYSMGRALRPVEDIRRQVDDISGGDLDQRVPVPHTGDEIAELATTMNAMLDRIDTARAQQMRFVNDASHELNSPLTTLVGLLDLAATTRQPIDPDTIDTVMMPEALRLKTMVADLLLLARADEKGVPLRLADVDLDEIVSAEATRLEALGRLQITAEIVAVRVRGDEDMIVRALRNIADNAARHTRDRLDFAMALSDDGTHVTITIADNGPGISDVDKDRVRQRFVRLDTARERASGGSGLGLAIVDEIVRAHQGDLIITDTPGGGATVGLRLPVHPWTG